MANGFFNVPTPKNEPVLGYGPGSPERKALKAQLEKMAGRVVEIAPRIGGRKVRTGRMAEAGKHGLTLDPCSRTRETGDPEPTAEALLEALEREAEEEGED